MRPRGRSAGALAGVGLVLSAVLAQAAPRVIVGRADAESLPGVSQALLLIDGPRRVLTVRRADGARPEGPSDAWREVDAAGLREVDRYGAPRLQRVKEPEPCEFILYWGTPVPPPPLLHGEGEIEQLAHAACGDTSCERQAWQIELPSEAMSLPLSALLSSGEVETSLILYVLDLKGAANPRLRYRVAELPSLPVLRWRGRPVWWIERDTPVPLPLELVEHFPRIHRAVWDEHARQQGLGQASLLYASEASVAFNRRSTSHFLHLNKVDLQSLGVADRLLPMRDAQLYRLHLRLRAADAPSQLSLRPAEHAPRSQPWLALESAQDDGELCRDRLAALSCAGLCHERVEQIAADPAGRRMDVTSADRSEQLQACRSACDERLARKLASARNDGRQERELAWQRLLQGLETMTGPGFFARPLPP